MGHLQKSEAYARIQEGRQGYEPKSLCIKTLEGFSPLRTSCPSIFLKVFFSLFSWTKFLLESSKGNIEGKGPGYLLIIWLKSAGRLIPHHRTGAPLRFWANEQKRLYP